MEKENKRDTAGTSPEAVAVSAKTDKQTRPALSGQTAELVQKGLEYERMENDILRLKNIAKAEGKSIEEYLTFLENNKAQKRREELIALSGGNVQLADYVLSLEGNPREDKDFAELKAAFPEIKEIGELPEEVTKASAQSGKNLLDCYLRYLFARANEKNKTIQQNSAAASRGIGSLKAGASSQGAALDREFIKGLWGNKN